MTTDFHFADYHTDETRLRAALATYSVLIVPGLRNSDERHWQSLWQARVPHSKRIRLRDWETPDLDAWRAAIIAELEQLPQPVVIIAHSFGTLASASVAQEFPQKIAALFLVAPADPDKFQVAERLPQNFLPVPTTLIGSTNDPWMIEQKAAYWALQWGADYLRLKNAGHINSESSLGMWHQGIKQLRQLLRKSKKAALNRLASSACGAARENKHTKLLAV